MALPRATIAVDAMGGDYAPEEIVVGAIRAAAELDTKIMLVGEPDQIQSCLDQHLDQYKDSNSNLSELIEVVAAEGMVSMDEKATSIRRKPKASINVAMNLVKEGKAKAVVSAGNSGAAMSAALFRLGRLKGIDRPAIGAVFPTMIPGKSVIVLDVGANMDCRPRYLEQFALMGTIYSQYILKVDTPRVGLLNIGEEPGKGNEQAVATHQLLKDNPAIPFIGNAEGKDVLSGQFDVIVCDGFVGNVLLKFAEAVGEVMLNIMKEELPKGWRGKLGTLLLKPNLRNIKQRIDCAEHGGALLFGVSGVCIISHGSSRAPSIFNAIRMAKEAVENQVIEKIEAYHYQHRAEIKETTASAN